MIDNQIIRHSVNAYNLSASSENKIHDDSVAKRFGFNGGLVPGVEVYAYMINPILQHYGEDWLKRGQATCRLLKPVYDGQDTQILGEITSADELLLRVETASDTCARGIAKMGSTSQQPITKEFSDIHLPDFASRPEASPISLSIGTTLGTFKQLMTQHDQEQYLKDVRETNDIFKKSEIVHPGWILRMANRALSMNVKLGPWIHVGSNIQNVCTAYTGHTLAAHGFVTNLYENKGHHFVVIDVTIIDEKKTCIALIEHTAIYRPRQVTETTE
ncbi:MAG: hypothetical protein CMM58_13425 [Rhodospirillaceae bacterium]|nr:hypothetical protein [Rhodospirillaceae bacterium]|tara:strand:- start:281 stop:1099 length:819 start_codon:yes stop_codon:yes gene_type:complete